MFSLSNIKTKQPEQNNMGIGVVLMGKSGTGKTTSLRNVNPDKALLIQVTRKALPFKSANWKPWDGKTKTGTVAVTDKSSSIVAAIQRASDNGKEIVIVDDFQYLMANEFMSRSSERGYDKFTDIARHAWDVMQAAINAPEHIRVYILTHTETDDYGLNATKAQIEGKRLLIVDDICAGGRTFKELAQKIKSIANCDIDLYVTHGFFNNSIDVINSILASGISYIHTSNNPYKLKHQRLENV
jgi:phosphoribosylpyrophosphate synthetase